MKKRSKMFLCLTVLFFVVSSLNAETAGATATISGTVYQSDGVTPLTGKQVTIVAYTGTPCSLTMVQNADVNSTTGTYSILGLPAGTYFLQTVSTGNYIMEYWATPQSVRSCDSAQSIVVTDGQAVTNINFQLDIGATISGTVYQSDGVTPLTGKQFWILAKTGTCAFGEEVGYANVNSATGTFTTSGLPAGSYYLEICTFENYTWEWWASPLSAWDCAGAQAITVDDKQSVANKNFQLDIGGSISGTVYESDGVTPLTGKQFSIVAYTGTPCGSPTWYKSTAVNSETGTYTINGLAAEPYYLWTSTPGSYLSEWWASPQSVVDCAGAQSIMVSAGQVLTGNNFQLDTVATISGTVYQSDGVTPLTGKNIRVNVYTDTPCGSHTLIDFTTVNSTTGTYTITGLSAGTYYLQTSSPGNYFSEWWSSAQSVRDCTGAQAILVTDGQVVTNRNFQLDPVATISGIVYQSDGITPLTGKNVWVYAYTGTPCGSSTQVGYATVNSTTGTYTITDLPAGTYYLHISSSDNYISEWWASPQSVWECVGAESIVVTDGQVVTNKNFQLDPGATISGTVYQSDGITPLTGKNIGVYVYTGTPCGSHTLIKSTTVNSSTGTYTITGLPAGTYFLQTVSTGNYFSEWWSSAQSVRDCTGAESILVNDGQAVTNRNFQLDPAATISGIVYQSDGITPLTGKNVWVYAYTGTPCGSSTQVGYATVNSTTGTYSVTGLPAGTYYLQTYSYNYISEWWASPQSVRSCTGAQAIVVTEGQAVTNIKFQLDPGTNISGTLYQSDGVTPLTGKQIWVNAYTGTPCGSRTWVGTASVNSATGAYTTSGLAAGTCYLRTSFSNNYISEWWASPQSVRDCTGAQAILIVDGQAVTGKNFQLELFSGLSGDVNNDNVVDLADAILSLQVVAGGNPANIYFNADVNGDNRIGMADIIYILQKAAHLK